MKTFSPVFVVLALGLLAGCLGSGGDPSDGMARGREPGATRAPKPISQLQLEVMDFSDLYVGAMWAAIDGAYLNEPDSAARVAALTWKVRYGSAAMEIASGNDPRTNLLDLAIFISAGQWALDRYWIPEVFGEEKGAPLRRVYREMNTRVWDLVADTLTDEQTANLRELVVAWSKTTPPSYEVDHVRFRNLEGVDPADFRRERYARGLLSNVRRWLGEVNTSLLFGERVMFYLQRTPRILNQQTDLTLAQIGEEFPIATLRPDFTAINEFVQGFPAQLGNGLEENADLLREVLPGVNTTLAEVNDLVAGTTELAGAANELTLTLNSSVERWGIRPEASQKLEKIDFEAALARASAALASLDSTVAGLNRLLETDARGVSRVGHLVEEIDTRTEKWIDLATQRALLLIGGAFLAGLLLLVAARILFRRKS